ncbi:MAG: hypothetical protein CM15mP21_8070 [Hyphomicrobiales bacterium]|nr:MAG: hypothetical protein CM15mP21_8070 [Hyphomicrobiales bacterium]
MRLIDSGAHPDLFVLARGYNRDTDKFRTDIPVDDVRRMKSFFQLGSADGNWRVCIIDSLDEMNKYSLNSLLKILEEPPEKSIFSLYRIAWAGCWIPSNRAVGSLISSLWRAPNSNR